MDYAIGLHPAKLLDEHLLGNRRDRAFQVGKAQDLAAKQVKQDDELPAAFEDLECVLNALGSRDRRQFFGLTFWCVPYFFVRAYFLVCTLLFRAFLPFCKVSAMLESLQTKR